MDEITEPMNIVLSKLWEIVKDREACCVAFQGVAKSQTHLVIVQQQNISLYIGTTTSLAIHLPMDI